MIEVLSKFKKGSTNKPQIGDKFIFLDDGKWGGSRLHIAIVNNIYKFKDLEYKTITRMRTSDEGKTYEENISIKQAIQQNIDNDFEDDPIYTKHPKQVLELYIPTYDDNMIYAIRTADDDYEWFSCDVSSFWQMGGLLSYGDYEERRGEYNYTTEMIEEKIEEYYNSEDEIDRQRYEDIKEYLKNLLETLKH